MKPVRIIRRETGLLEGVCEHGVGHPLYASIDWMMITDGAYNPLKRNPQDSAWGIHGCDGCCSDTEWQIETLKDSVRRAHDLIIERNDMINLLREKLNENSL